MDHINHVESQMQYGLIVAAVAFVFYLISGFTENQVLGLLGGIVTLFLFTLVIKAINSKQQAAIR